jgi:hypothetical protein
VGSDLCEAFEDHDGWEQAWSADTLGASFLIPCRFSR